MKFWPIVLAALASDSLLAIDFSFITHREGRPLYAVAEQRQDYVVALDIYKKTQNRWRPQDSRRLAGQLQRQTVALPRDHDTAEVFNFYRRQLLPQHTSTLFFCRARDCGNSSVWANNHFNIRQLYGLDQFQFYGVYQWQLKPDSTIYYITLYTVRRGNGRIYAQVDVFLPDAIDSQGSAESISQFNE